jgi:hypothetical protein
MADSDEFETDWGSPFGDGFIEIQDRAGHNRPGGQFRGVEFVIARRFAHRQ